MLIELIQSNGLHIPLADNSVHCVVTSPPYWSLRDYGVDGQLGLESSPEEYVARMVEVFREVKRVLHPSGVVWLNLGDSYCATPKGSLTDNTGAIQSHCKALESHFTASQMDKTKVAGLKPKDLVGIPWRVAFALNKKIKVINLPEISVGKSFQNMIREWEKV